MKDQQSIRGSREGAIYLRSTPNETILLDGTEVLLKLRHIGLIICYIVSKT